LQSLLQARSRRERATVLTPHPLEAGRLLGCGAAQVQADRLQAARELAERFGCVVVLKGSGTVIGAPACVPRINPTGNGRLATAGTGDVLAGMVAARLATGANAFEAASGAVYEHGVAADRWPAELPLTAAALARKI
jgi:ADP-dependent NAD(P)H-hydrate dehydratase / NAD(P)H-hydrate epimerase